MYHLKDLHARIINAFAALRTRDYRRARNNVVR